MSCLVDCLEGFLCQQLILLTSVTPGNSTATSCRSSGKSTTSAVTTNLNLSHLPHCKSGSRREARVRTTVGQTPLTALTLNSTKQQLHGSESHHCRHVQGVKDFPCIGGIAHSKDRTCAEAPARSIQARGETSQSLTHPPFACKCKELCRLDVLGAVLQQRLFYAILFLGPTTFPPFRSSYLSISS